MKQRIPIDELLEHAGWLRRLATSLVRDAGVAEDLVQETWVAAMHHPPEGGASPRPWLSRVVRNLARNLRRGSVRRADREALVSADANASIPGPQALAEEAEAQRILAEAVSALDEPLLSVVVLRYFRGLDSGAIARDLGIAPGTVRWRLGRAREELRTTLDQSFEGGRSSWALALGAVLRRQPAPPPTQVATLSGSLSPAGLTTLSIAAVLGIVLLAATAFPSLDLKRNPELPSAPEESASALARPVDVAPALLAQTSAREASRFAVGSEVIAEPTPSPAEVTQHPDSGPMVSGHVLVDGLTPLEPVKLRFEAPPYGNEPPQYILTESGGTFSIRLAEERTQWVIKAPGFASEGKSSYDRGTGPRAGIQVRLKSQPQLTGRFLDPATGRPPVPTPAQWEGGYQLTGTPARGGEYHASGVLSIDDEGRFYIPIEMTGELHGFLQFERRGVGRKVVEVPPYDPAEGLDLGDFYLDPGNELTFQIRDEFGEPIDGSIAKHEDWEKVAQTGPDGKHSLPVVSEDGTQIRFAALRHVDQLLSVRGGDHVDIALERANALDLTIAGLEEDQLDQLRIVVDDLNAFQDSGIFGNAWGLDGRREQDFRDGRLRYSLGKTGHVILQHVKPNTLFRIEVQNRKKEVLAVRDVALGPQEWQELVITLEP